MATKLILTIKWKISNTLFSLHDKSYKVQFIYNKQIGNTLSIFWTSWCLMQTAFQNICTTSSNIQKFTQRYEFANWLAVICFETVETTSVGGKEFPCLLRNWVFLEYIHDKWGVCLTTIPPLITEMTDYLMNKLRRWSGKQTFIWKYRRQTSYKHRRMILLYKFNVSDM
jgi:hypothetical protein